jgi:agmatine deiminase
MLKRYLLILLTIVCLSALNYAQQHRVRTVAEWEPALGTLIRWPLGIPSELVVELAKDDLLFVLVKNETHQQNATFTFESWNVNLANCRFVIADTYSHWTRDWGPQFVFDTLGNIAIADPIFNGYPWVPGCFLSEEKPPEITSERAGHRSGYGIDNAVNAILADFFGLPLIELPFFLTGGNFMSDGFRDGFSTQQMLQENAPICDEECFRNGAAELMGLSNYNILIDPEINGIQHIDCFAKLLNEETILVKEVPEWHPEYACAEHLAWELSQLTNVWGRPYNIVRIFCGSYSGTSVAAYTNALILNKKVLVPLFGISTDQQALETYQQAMPGYQVMGFTGPWYYYDALHCRTMGIFDPHMIRIVHRPMDAEVQVSYDMAIEAQIIDHSKTGLDPELMQLKWRRDGQTLWSTSMFSTEPGTDNYSAPLPVYEPDVTVHYYITATDSTGRNERLPRTAPGGYFSFVTIDTLTTAVQPEPDFSSRHFTIYPTAFAGHVNVRFELAESQMVQIDLIAADGRLERTLLRSQLPGGSHHFMYDLSDVKSGVYFFRLNTGKSVEMKKGFRIK